MDPKELDKRFTYHPPKGDQPERYESIRLTGRLFANLLDSVCPESREKSLALTKIEEAVMWANAAVARNPKPNVPEPPEPGAAVDD